MAVHHGGHGHGHGSRSTKKPPTPNLPPVNTVAPSITGTAQSGQTLTAATGTWLYSPSSYAYQWKANGVAIGGATAATFLLTDTQIGALITVAVTGINAYGNGDTATSAATSAVIAAGGGSPTPALDIDFENGAYSIAGVSKTLAQVCIENTDWGPFNPLTDVVAGVGLTCSSSDATNVFPGPVLTTAAKAALLNGFVAVVTYAVNATVDGVASAKLDLIDDILNGNNDWQWRLQFIGNSFEQISDYNATGNSPIVAGGTFKSAIRMADAAMAVSRNGGANLTVTGNAPLSTATDIAITVTASGDNGTATATIKRVRFFALSDYAASDLPALSA